MKIKTVLLILFGLFFGFAFLVDCVHKKSNTEISDGVLQTKMDSEKTVNTLSAQEKEGDWVLLFDGETLNGWRDFKSENIGDGWTVEDGSLVALGKGGDSGGDIITDSVYESFDLKLEWKILEGGNSGVFFHVLEEDYPAVYATGPEYQLIDDIGFPEELENWQTSGANYAMHPPANTKIKPAGEWNTTEIIVEGPNVIHFLNGVKVVEYKLWTDEWNELVNNGKWDDYPDYGKAMNGHIGLQDHGSKIWFRNIKIKEL